MSNLKSAQATRLSDAAINDVYRHFEDQKPTAAWIANVHPDLVLKSSFRKTMGRYVGYRPDGTHRMRAA